jgi:hypothetical protein
MAAQRRDSAGVDLGDVMAVLAGQRPEAYPFERHVALITLATWTLWPRPDYPAVVSVAHFVSAALKKEIVTWPRCNRRSHVALVGFRGGRSVRAAMGAMSG